MEEAGRAVFRKILSLRRPYQEILILAGPGNNGGDALVAARLLHAAGLTPQVFLVQEANKPEQETPDRQWQRQSCEASGLRLETYAGRESFARFSRATLIVDGVLGLGVKGSLRPGQLAEALASARAIEAQLVLAIDLPSGLDADRWDQEPPLPATHTITFGAPKPVHLFSPRPSLGALSVVVIGFHPAAVAKALAEGPLCASLDQAPKPWASLGPDAHKYTRGHLLIIGGSPGKGGAPLLAAEAALRCGAGWVSVAPLSEQQTPPLPAHFTYESFARETALSWEACEAFLRARRVKALLIGPGTMQNPCSPSFLQGLAAYAASTGLFLVFDAGALQDFAGRAAGLRFDPGRTLLTPHPGEWQAMAKEQPDLSSLEALEKAWDLTAALGVSVCYKSARPLTLSRSAGRSQLKLSPHGDQRLAKAGSGDLLAGAALALGAAGLDAALAAAYAQDLIARAAARASRTAGFHGLAPEDIAAALGPCLDA